MTQRRRRAQLILAAALAALPAIRADAVDASQPAIIQIFESTHRNVEHRTPDIFMAGYGGIWLPPPGRAQGGQSVGYDVYDRFDLGSAGNPTLYGTETGLKTAVDQLHKGAVNVYTDLVWNHNAFWDHRTTNFVAGGGYPGMLVGGPTATDARGDFHFHDWSGDYYGRLAGLIDIAHEKSGATYEYIRNPVPGFANNIPAGTPGVFERTANIPTENNRRFYPDLQGPSTTINGVTYYHWNGANPMTGDPVPENVTGYLMRHTRWMVEEIGVDGFRLDATKHMVQYVDSNGQTVSNPDWVLESYDVATNAGTKTPYLNGTRKRVFGFGEYAGASQSAIQNSIKKDANANRDALDFQTHYALRDNLTGNGAVNNWHNIKKAAQDLHDDGLVNGSQGVTFDRSHDDGGAFLSNLANAYLMLRPGNAIIYFNAKQFGANRDFPRDGNGDALGGQHGDDLTKLVQIRNSHGRGNYRERWIDDAFNPNGFSNIFVYERSNSAVVGLNSRLDNGYDERTVQTDFAVGSKLIELTGNATNLAVDPSQPVSGAGGQIHDMVTVNASGQITIRVPRNRNSNGAQHNKGYVIYGPATPRGTLNVTNVSHTIAPETQTASNNGTARLTAFDVIKQNSFEVQLQTNAVVLPDGSTDLEAGGDNAMLRFNGGIDINGNGVVDVTSPSDISYGFDNFVTEKNPRWTGGNGLYRQVIDTTELEEGFHYITARAFRHRAVSGTPIYSDFRKVIYVDRERPVSTLEAIVPIGGSPDDRDIIVKSTDKTASGVSVLYNTGAGLTLDQIADLADNVQTPAGAYDRDLFKYSINDWRNGNNAITIVTFEPSYDPAQLYAGGGVSIQRVAGLAFTTGSGAGLADLDFNGSISTSDVNLFYGSNVLRSNNTSFNPAADLNADGLVDEVDNVLLLPWLNSKGASTTVINNATSQRFAYALDTDGTLNVAGGTLTVADPSAPGGSVAVSGVPLTFITGFSITAGKTINKSGTQTLNISGTQNHGANAALITSAGATNMNSNGGTNLAVTTTGAGSAINFTVTQNLRALAVADAGVATLTTASANNVNGGKSIHTRELLAPTGKLDLKNNNLAVHYTGESTYGNLLGADYTGILGMLQDGSNNGLWNGATGITSSSAAAMASQTALAAAEASDVLGLTGSQTALWYGHTIDATTVLIRYTWGGDANLSGHIDADDYFQINANYGRAPRGHFTGDFNYSGSIDGDDFFIIDSNFSAQLGTMSAAVALSGVQSVPEPSTTLLILAPMLLARRVRRSHERKLVVFPEPPTQTLSPSR